MKNSGQVQNYGLEIGKEKARFIVSYKYSLKYLYSFLFINSRNNHKGKESAMINSKGKDVFMSAIIILRGNHRIGLYIAK
jgi:hypothetical protein